MTKKDIDKNVVFILIILWIIISLTGTLLVLQKQAVSGRVVAEIKVNVVAPPPPPPLPPGPPRPTYVPPPLPEVPEIPEEIIPEEIVPEEIRVPTIQVPGRTVVPISSRTILIILISLAVLAVIIGTITILVLYELVILDADALLFIISNKIPLKTILNKVFGKRIRIVATHSTLKKLSVLTRSPNARIRNAAVKSLEMIKELRISIKKGSHIKLGKRWNTHIISHSKSLINSLHANNLKVYHIHPIKKGYGISKHTEGQSIGKIIKKK